jgi:heptosyltransferase-2
MAPGAAYGRAKQWPPERFGRLARLLHERRGVVSVVVGSRADRAAGDDSGGGGSVVNLIGQTDLPLLAGVMARCRAFVSNDSGAMHLAAAVGLPVTAIFGSTDERATAPLNSVSAPAPPHEILTCDVWCRPCMLRECPIDHRCMTGIDPERVCEAVERQIAHRSASVES